MSWYIKKTNLLLNLQIQLTILQCKNPPKSELESLDIQKERKKCLIYSVNQDIHLLLEKNSKYSRAYSDRLPNYSKT